MASQSSVAFLRAINVGGRRVVKDDLIDVFTSLGFDDVSTFLASGNVLFSHEGAADVDQIGDALEKALGYEVPTTLRSAEELAAIVEFDPFSADAVSASTGKPQVMLLFDPLTDAARKEALTFTSADDQLVFGARELHWLPSAGVADSELDVKALARVLGTNTVRTANTIRRLSAKHG